MAGSPRFLVGKVGNRCPRDSLEGRRSRAERFSGRTEGRYSGITKHRQKIAEQAKRSPAMVCNNVLHVIDRECLLAASRQPRKRSALGVDQGTATPYADTWDDTLRDLHERWRDKRYVAPPVERVGIEKAEGKQRPIGKPCCEDKRVQRTVVRILEAIVAQDCHGFSHGCRKGHSQHHALPERREQCRTLHNAWIVDAEVSGFCDNLAWGHRRECLQQRGRDGGILRRRGKWLHAGVRESGALTSPDKGAPQGGVISPTVSKVCLHRVLDAWVVQDVHPRRQGRCFLTRCADDFLLGCEWEADARRVMEVLPKRFAHFRLTMHPEKTVLTACKRPPGRDHSAGGKGTCDFLGLTHYEAKTRRGYWVIKRKTVGKRLRRFMKGRWTGCRANRHEPLKEQYQP